LRHAGPLAASAHRACWREIPRAIDTEATFLDVFAGSAAAFWLDSRLVEPGRSRWSYLGDAAGPNSALIQYRLATGTIEVFSQQQSGAGILPASGRDARSTQPIGILDYLADAVIGMPGNLPPCPFVGGHVGWLGYELGQDGGMPTQREAATPDAFFIRADRFIAVDHLAGRSFVVAIDAPEEQARAQRWVDQIAARLADLRSAPPPTPLPQADLVTFTLARNRAGYLADIETALDWIRAGETYQLCLTNEISCTAAVDLLLLYRILRRRNPAPFAAFLRWPGGAVLSASPERFLSVDPLGNVETKPIKGTIGRAADPTEDRRRAEALLASDKDRAENIMIVDLLRNDLSRVCVPGSVAVPALCALESYATVHQLVSTVRGTLAPGKTAIDLVRACFPGGSMTGAPKHRTLTLIDQLERRARGIYSGALGWIGADGASDLSIAIRLIVAAEGRLSIGAGGGIVAQSVPEAEFDEMLLKARASIEAIALAVTGERGPERYRLVGADQAQGSGPG
jgi:para-aminobenzoate synthetase